MEETRNEKRLAVLIDADNASKADLQLILEEVTRFGTPTIKRAYGDWSSSALSGWKEVLLNLGAVAVQQYAYTKGKNATDAAMIIDAMDFLHSGRVDGFVLISSDSDFTPLALRIREAGLLVVGVGEEKRPRLLLLRATFFAAWRYCAKSSRRRIPIRNRLRPVLRRKRFRL